MGAKQTKKNKHTFLVLDDIELTFPIHMDYIIYDLKLMQYQVEIDHVGMDRAVCPFRWEVSHRCLQSSRNLTHLEVVVEGLVQYWAN